MLATRIELRLPEWIADVADPSRAYLADEERMGVAIRLARANVERGDGGPFGAAVFDGAGRLISAGVNRVVPLSCSLAHAEIMAIVAAQRSEARHRLNEGGAKIILATSAQPCCQCYGASFWAGVDEILIGARAEDVHELTEFDEGPLPEDWMGELNRRGILARVDILREEARGVLAQYADKGGAAY